MKQTIHTEQAPSAIGPYSQAVQHGQYVYISGQIGLDPQTKTLVSEQLEPQTEQVLKNLSAVAEATGANLQQILQLTVYIVPMERFEVVNETMRQFFQPPYPARAAIGVSALPKGALVEMTATLALNES